MAMAIILIFAGQSLAAIDSAEKRRSAFNWNAFGGPGVTPNASKDQEWRQQAMYSYSGILAGAPVTPTGNLLLRMLEEDFP
jgi:hypothetical protein